MDYGSETLKYLYDGTAHTSNYALGPQSLKPGEFEIYTKLNARKAECILQLFVFNKVLDRFNGVSIWLSLMIPLCSAKAKSAGFYPLALDPSRFLPNIGKPTAIL